MSDLRAPDSIEAQVRDVMNVNPADPASRQMARRVVEALGRGGVSEARSRMPRAGANHDRGDGCRGIRAYVVR